MADLTASTAVRNSYADLTLNAAAASQTIDMLDKRDEKTVLVVQNNNGAGMTTTVTVAPGDYPSNVLGTLSVEVRTVRQQDHRPAGGRAVQNLRIQVHGRREHQPIPARYPTTSWAL